MTRRDEGVIVLPGQDRHAALQRGEHDEDAVFLSSAKRASQWSIFEPSPLV